TTMVFAATASAWPVSSSASRTDCARPRSPSGAPRAPPSSWEAHDDVRGLHRGRVQHHVRRAWRVRVARHRPGARSRSRPAPRGAAVAVEVEGSGPVPAAPRVRPRSRNARRLWVAGAIIVAALGCIVFRGLDTATPYL